MIVCGESYSLIGEKLLQLEDINYRFCTVSLLNLNTSLISLLHRTKIRP